MVESEVKKSRFHSLFWRLGFWILGTCGLIYLGTLAYSYGVSREMAIRSAEKEAVEATRASVKEIKEVLESIEESTRLLASVLGVVDPSEEELGLLLQSFVATDPKIYGSAAAFVPFGFDESREWFSPYYHREGDELTFADLAADNYRYWEWDWYTDVVASGEPQWSEPYVDEGGGNVLMVTYPVPFSRETSNGLELRGMVTADLSLEWLHDVVRSIRIGETGYGVILSRTGQIVSHPDESLMDRRQPIFDLEEFDPEPEVAEILPRMLQGEAGFQSFYDRFRQKRARLTYAPVGRAGWSLAVIYPEDELMADVHSLFLKQLAILVLGLAVLMGVVWILSRYFTRPIKALATSAGLIATGDLDLELPAVTSKDEIGALTGSFHHMRDSLKTYIHDLQVTTAAKERLESELQIARKIQMDMLPKGDIGGGENDGYELSAKLIPARAVGGDLYYHFESNGKLYFMIGDVSGKGVPAALFMARARTLFETIAQLESDIGATVAAMNRSLCKENEAGMFVTCFAGILDGATGVLRFAVGGFDPPVSLSGNGSEPQFIEFEGGPVLGLLEVPHFETNLRTIAPGETLVLFTDGVSEALNEKEEFYNAERLLDVLADVGSRPASKVSTLVMKSVKDFAGNAPQSDDITVMALRYTPTGGLSKAEE